MSDFIEGGVKEIIRWSDGKGADVKLGGDTAEYYYEGNMPIPPGICKFEIIDGEGIHSKKKMIISVEQPKVNPAFGQSTFPIPPPGAQSQVKMIQLPENDLQSLIRSRIGSQEYRIRALDAAATIYVNMQKFEKDPNAAAHEVLKIAKILEGYLA